MPGYKTYKTFDEFFADQPADKQGVITVLRRFVKKVAPDLIEGSKWGNGVWFNGDLRDLPIAFVHIKLDHMQFGFFGGTMLDDAENVLEGSAKFVRHVKIHSVDDINEETLKPLIQQASKLDYKK